MVEPVHSLELPRPSELPKKSTLPDPLVTFEGDPIETATKWRERRRPELKRLFEQYVYGHMPDPPRVTVDCHRTASIFDGLGELAEIEIHFADLPTDAPTIDLALFTPATTDQVPVFLGLNHGGSHATVVDETVTITDAGERFGADERGVSEEFWCVKRILERGYGFATFHQADIDPDRDDFTDGIHSFYPDRDCHHEAQWGTLAAWGWGLQRGVDALQRIDGIRDESIALIGHSRRGKAALLAGAFDERVALVVPHQSGTGGCALSRDNDQESITQINGAFPHWFNDIFPAFGGRPERLPIDQHLLIALVAPRPLLDTEGARDHWANPGRALDALHAANTVYDLLGETGTVGDGLLYGDDRISEDSIGNLLQYRRETGHTLNRGYWETILDVADIHLR